MEKSNAYQVVDYKSAEATVAFNCPPDLAKLLRSKGQRLPNVVVLGDTPSLGDIPLASPEFILMGQLFMNGGFDFANGKVKQPLYLVGPKERVDAQYEALRLAFYGPSESEYKSRLRSKVGKDTREMLLKESEYFALKDKRGKQIPFCHFVRALNFEDFEGEKVVIDELNLKISHLGMDTYSIQYGCLTPKRIELSFEGEILPPWPIPSLHEIGTGYQFKVVVIGSDSGFGPGPTTGYLVTTYDEDLLWDCPPYCAQTLTANGKSLGDVRKIIVSHVHDDHANAMLSFMINKFQKVELISTSEILYSLFQKVSALSGLSVEACKKYFRIREIKVGTPEIINGHRFDFHYGVHSIPSIGCTISRNGEHCVTFTGDTAYTEYLQKAFEAKAITNTRMEQLLSLTDTGKTIFVDAGDAMIHGKAADYLGKERPHIQMYHLSALPEELRKKANLVRPGNAYAVRLMKPGVTETTLINEMLEELGIRESRKWTNTLADRSENLAVEMDNLVIQSGSSEADTVYLISHGFFDVRIGDTVVATLEKGNFFGEQALLTGDARNADIWSATRGRLIAIPGELFREMILEDHSLVEEERKVVEEKIRRNLLPPEAKNAILSAKERLEQYWEKRVYISEVLKYLRPGDAYQLSLRVEQKEFAPGTVIIRKGSRTDEVYIVSQGRVEVVKNPDEKAITLEKTIIGENVILGYSTHRNADVITKDQTVVLVVSGEDFLKLYEEIPRVRFEMQQTALKRGIRMAS